MLRIFLSIIMAYLLYAFQFSLPLYSVLKHMIRYSFSLTWAAFPLTTALLHAVLTQINAMWPSTNAHARNCFDTPAPPLSTTCPNEHPSFASPMLRYIGQLHEAVHDLKQSLNLFFERDRYERYHHAAYLSALEEQRRALQNFRARDDEPPTGYTNPMYHLNMIHHNPGRRTTTQNAGEDANGNVLDNDTPHARRTFPMF